MTGILTVENYWSTRSWRAFAFEHDIMLGSECAPRRRIGHVDFSNEEGGHFSLDGRDYEISDRASVYGPLPAIHKIAGLEDDPELRGNLWATDLRVWSDALKRIIRIDSSMADAPGVVVQSPPRQSMRFVFDSRKLLAQIENLSEGYDGILAVLLVVRGSIWAAD